VTVREIVGLRRFVSWLDGSTARLRLEPEGFEVALYRSDPCLNTDPARIPVTCVQIPDFDDEHLQGSALDLIDHPAWSSLDRICQLVYGIEGCPGCGGPDRLCPGFVLDLEGADGLVDAVLVDRQTGEVVAKGRPTGKGNLTLAFRPEARGRIDGARYVLLLLPVEGALEKAGGRATVRPRIGYTCGD
jgi:hypothetical protein